ncbi:hypothetical protein, partial [Vibrio algivorus]|uniref:hypothetical protein n=1 Tax=Vibrio algivorus TaxID=1667024 RepID=UPI00232DEAB8
RCTIRSLVPLLSVSIIIDQQVGATTTFLKFISNKKCPLRGVFKCLFEMVQIRFEKIEVLNKAPRRVFEEQEAFCYERSECPTKCVSCHH